MKKVWYGLAVIVFAFMAIFLYSWYRVHDSLLLPHFIRSETPESYHLTYETRTFANADGVALQGWYVPAKDAKAVVIVVHGYRDLKGAVVEHGAYLHKAGYSTFFIDLASDRPHTKATLGIQEYKDVAAAYNYMKSLPENNGKKIGIFGGSMGASASIIAMGKTEKGDFLIASVPFANYKSLLAQRIKLENLPAVILPFIQLGNAFELGWDYASYAPENYIQNIHKPMLFISAEKDTNVNAEDARKLYDLASPPKYYWRANTRHDVYKDSPREYEKHMLDFLGTVN